MYLSPKGLFVGALLWVSVANAVYIPFTDLAPRDEVPGITHYPTVKDGKDVQIQTKSGGGFLQKSSHTYKSVAYIADW